VSPLRRLLRVLLAIVTLFAFSGSARAEYYCFGMQRTLARCCCASVDHDEPPAPEPSIERAPCCERRVTEAPAPVVRLEGSAASVTKAPLLSVTLDPFVVHAAEARAVASLRPIDTGPRAGPRVALYAKTSRYLI